VFDKILIANRGEIACRIARTARRLGMRTVAVYSRADRHAAHVARCDEAFLIGPAPAAESYLCGARILDAARRCGAQAVHPGYGFLSENPAFAEQCADSGIVFIGPPPAAIRAMGDKSAAKERMAKAGVPVVAGYRGDDQREDILRAAAEQCGYPLLIKAAAGGGGKGMRIVERADSFADNLASVKREARAAFADQRVLLERYLAAARHVEVQVFADAHGNIVDLFERDCSIQRRYQKIIEEAPAPGIDGALRRRLGDAAIDAAKAVGYVGAGTVEFLLDADREFYFMEMNTRLQVEHPVTEMITGQDLVEWQLRVAAGLPLPCGRRDLRIDGHAMEARIYAENPGNDFLPATGTLAVYRPPPVRDWLRIDSGVDAGDCIEPFYDPMLAKLIVRGEDRESARRRLRESLAAFDIAGVTTNLDLLHELTGLDDFIAAALDTRLIERNRDALLGGKGAPPDLFLAIATLFEATATEHQTPPPIGGNGGPFSPWSPGTPWQLNLPCEASCVFAAARSDALEYTVHFERGRAWAQIDGARCEVKLTPLAGGRFRFQCGAHARNVAVDKAADVIHINLGGRRCALTVVDAAKAADEHAGEHPVTGAGLSAPMPGAVIAVHVSEHQRVQRGAPLLVLEAMKMEHTVSAPYDGVVEELLFRPGDQVREGDTLLRLEAAGD